MSPRFLAAHTTKGKKPAEGIDMNDAAQSIGTWAMNQGIGVLMLLFAIYYLNNQNKKSAADVKSALDAASVERNAKFDQMTQGMQHLTQRVAECETDRRTLWTQIVDLAKKQSP